jgi:ABC-type dipeptide/oligopeptide/nickel transport system ATPase component
MPAKKKTVKDDDIINFYEHIPEKYKDNAENPNFDVHNINLPFRMCIVAPSGSGKTNFLMNVLKVFSQGKGTFISVDIITANKDEPLYKWLETEYKGFTVKEGLINTPALDDFDKQYNHLVVWDDLVLEKNQKVIENYYLRARKQNVSVIYLSQSYYDIPKFIRKNCNYLVLLNLNGSKRELTAILNEACTNVNKETLLNIYRDATSENLRPLIVTLGKIEDNKKYRKGWKQYYKIKDWYKPDKPRDKKPIYSSSDSE